MDNILVSLDSVNKVYGDEVKTQVLFDVSLEIPQGQFLALIGPSGSGKSTLLNILGALDRPSSGTILINQQNLVQLNENQLADFRNKFLGFVFQFHYLLPEFTTIENVLLPYWIGKCKNPLGFFDNNFNRHCSIWLEVNVLFI
jgi:lipoprotein-releasing system ATP-binding protein